MQIVAIIPARYASKRLPGKPLVKLKGKPMIQHVYERVRKCPMINRVLVATDDQRILKAVEAIGGEAILTSQDHPSGTDRIAEAAELIGLDDEDLVVNIQGDEPLVNREIIERMVKAFNSHPPCDMATIAVRMKNARDFFNPNVVKVVVDHNYKALYFSRAPIPYDRDNVNTEPSFLKHLGFYVYKKAFLIRFTNLTRGPLEVLENLEQLRALEHGYSIKVTLSPVETYGVDVPEDIENVLAHLG